MENPELIGKNGEETLKFNVSYSNELILYAVALNRKIGLDLEYIRPDFADTQIVERFFF